MYESFFGFKEKPFNPTHDLRYLYLSPSHRETLAHLIYGIQEKRGFVMITGEVGTGKTRLLYTLLEQQGSQVKAAFVFFPKLSFHDFLRYVLDNFGLNAGAMTPAQCLTELHRFLREQHRQGQTTVLVIDEAQNLPISLLEEIRMLSNLETAGDTFLQIVLVGQPELRRKLQAQRLRQLRQRIGIGWEIRPLSFAETRNYIEHRCYVAGLEAPTLFTRSAFSAIYAYSGGIPRVINTVCERALLTGYAEGHRRITRGLIRRSIREMNMPFRSRVWTIYTRRIAAVLASLIFLGGGLYVMGDKTSIPSALLHLRDSVLSIQRLFDMARERFMPNIIVPNSHHPSFPLLPESPGVLSQDHEPEGIAETQRASEALEKNPSAPERAVEKTFADDKGIDKGGQKIEFPVTKIIKKGDMVSKYAMEIYGSSNNEILEFIKKNNPGIKDIENIKIGEKITFPDISLQ